MSGGTPVGGGFMRQRHSQGYASSGDDLEDDACSRLAPQSPSFPGPRSWVEVMEIVLWIASAVFIIYYGDLHYNFIYLLWHDARIRSMSAWGVRKSSEMWEISSASALPFITILGLISFCLFSFALWPIWSFLTLPLVFTLFMACMVILPYLMHGTFRRQTDVLRMD
ncbi:uncharacterized protein LOC132279935 isoform X2 [Cornus florida]|uniref:uncharacterized protein LOC132279935 isoform X2 n=1 Tax=Cornus florida TaxID=4283 RepID=UPI00289D1105|nr:uncharacterized protein LOC132279935 isoform X2 [Cornus florida]